MLSNWGMSTRCHDRGTAVLSLIQEAQAREEPFQLVLLDCTMPDVRGAEVAKDIRGIDGGEAIRILILSSAGHPLAPGEESKLGITRVLTKPIKQSNLLDAIADAFGEAGRKKDKTPSIATPRPTGIRSMKVLLAEDGRVNQLVAVKMLKKRGHEVVVAEDGQVAVDRHEKQSFDAILMDVQMPHLDGLEATKIIREREKESGEHVPVIAMTANAMKGDREKCLDAGMDDYIAKPIRSDKLFNILEKYAPERGDNP